MLDNQSSCNDLLHVGVRLTPHVTGVHRLAGLCRGLVNCRGEPWGETRTYKTEPSTKNLVQGVAKIPARGFARDTALSVSILF